MHPLYREQQASFGDMRNLLEKPSVHFDLGFPSFRIRISNRLLPHIFLWIMLRRWPGRFTAHANSQESIVKLFDRIFRGTLSIEDFGSGLPAFMCAP